MNENTEKFPVKGWEGFYEVDKLGNVFSLPRTVQFIDGRMFHFKYRKRKIVIAGMGYAMLVLCNGTIKKTVSVHRLMAFTFFGDPTGNRDHVNHKNGVKTDNRIENLEWVTRNENIQHSYDILDQKKAALGKFGALNCGSKAIIGTALDGSGRSISFSALQEAERNGFSAGNICMCLKGKRKHHKGFTWSYDFVNPTNQHSLAT